MNKKTQIEILERAISDAQRAMNVQESIWMQEWEAARNPFIAINEWNNNHDRRMAYIQPWLDAKAELTKFRSRE
jgi:hypothetical protein